MDLGIKDRLALVTGASRGIGRAIALELAREGARVIMVARTQEALEKVRDQTKDPSRHHLLAVDLMSADGPQQVAETALKLGQLDLMVHNLGGSAGVFDVFAPAEDWKKVWHFNVGICHELNRRLIPPMVERRWGRVVHLSTLSTTTYSGAAAYVSAKCALDGYVKCISREVAKHNVIVNAVAPGAIALEGRYFKKLLLEDPAGAEKYYDDHLPIRRFGTGEDVASTVAFLCSEQASYLAGALVAVDGGWK